MKWIVRDIVKDGASVSVGASETAYVISENLYIHDPSHLVVDITCSGVTAATGITLKLQDSVDDITWTTKSSEAQVAVSGNGVVSFNLKIENSSDQADMPLRPLLRLIATTGAGDAVTVSGIKVSHWGW